MSSIHLLSAAALLAFSFSAYAADTSGCSAYSSTKSQNRVQVSVQRSPRSQCWNIGSTGVQVSYHWTQVNNPRSEAAAIGFWVSLNGKAEYAKATSNECYRDSRGGYGHDTSGNVRYNCEARKTFTVDQVPSLFQYAYSADGRLNSWDVQVAVSLDDHGRWDSQEGANYRFQF